MDLRLLRNGNLQMLVNHFSSPTQTDSNLSSDSMLKVLTNKMCRPVPIQAIQ